MNDSTTPDTVDEDGQSLVTQPTPARQRLDELRAGEATRRESDRHLRTRVTLSGTLIGALIAMFVGFLGTAVLIADDGAREFGFRFYRPDLSNFIRLSTAYLFSGAVVGAGISYLIALSRSTTVNPLFWLGGALVASIAVPLLIGLTLPLTVLIFFDFFSGLRPGLWFSAFVQVFLGSFLDGYIYMVTVVYAGALGGLCFGVLTAVSAWTWIKDPLGGAVAHQTARMAVYLALTAIVAAIPFLVVAFGPLDLLRSLTGFLAGENLR